MGIEEILLSSVFITVLILLLVLADTLRYKSKYGGRLFIIFPSLDPELIDEDPYDTSRLKEMAASFKERTGEDVTIIEEPTATELKIMRV